MTNIVKVKKNGKLMLCVQLRDLKSKDSIEFESIVLVTTFS